MDGTGLGKVTRTMFARAEDPGHRPPSHLSAHLGVSQSESRRASQVRAARRGRESVAVLEQYVRRMD